MRNRLGSQEDTAQGVKQFNKWYGITFLRTNLTYLSDNWKLFADYHEEIGEVAPHHFLKKMRVSIVLKIPAAANTQLQSLGEAYLKAAAARAHVARPYFTYWRW